MVTIGVYQLLNKIALYEHICLENINKLYKYSGKYDDKQHYNTILRSGMVSITEGFIDRSPMSPGPSATLKNPSARK